MGRRGAVPYGGDAHGGWGVHDAPNEPGWNTGKMGRRGAVPYGCDRTWRIGIGIHDTPNGTHDAPMKKGARRGRRPRRPKWHPRYTGKRDVEAPSPMDPMPGSKCRGRFWKSRKKFWFSFKKGLQNRWLGGIITTLRCKRYGREGCAPLFLVEKGENYEDYRTGHPVCQACGGGPRV